LGNSHVLLGVNTTVAERCRNGSGKFVQKSEEARKVRSIRLTDKAWDELGRIAGEQDITRADLIEQLIEKGLSRYLDSGGRQNKIDRNDLELKRNSVLVSLNLGSQAPQYKGAKKVLDKFIKMLSD
jgi:predicted DNA-binding ribbon-helix-helix protein